MRRIVFSLLFVSACQLQANPGLDPCPTGAAPQWQDVQPFFENYCHRCHHSGIAGDQRGGAPILSNFDNAKMVDDAVTRIYWRSAHGRHSMPPAPPSPTAAERSTGRLSQLPFRSASEWRAKSTTPAKARDSPTLTRSEKSSNHRRGKSPLISCSKSRRRSGRWASIPPTPTTW